MKTSIYDIVTQQIIESIEKGGTLPWRRPWKTAGLSFPMNVQSKQLYRGINIILLSLGNFATPGWLTFKQCNALGGRVIKGEKGSLVVYWKLLEKVEERDEKLTMKKIPFLKYSVVFNIEQCEGLSNIDLFNEKGCVRYYGLENNTYNGGPEVTHGGNEAFYSIERDTVVLPPKSAFNCDASYFTTLYHELVHSTGNASRLGRPSIVKPSEFGSESYGKEELIAEIGASFLCRRFGTSSYTSEDSSSYIAGWVKALKGDSKLIVEAASSAQKAVDWINGIRATDDSDLIKAT